MLNDLQIKTERLVGMLSSERLGGVLLNSQHNFAWLTGGGTNGVDLSRENGAASLLVTGEGKRYLLASRVEMPRMLAEEVSAEAFEPVEYGWQDDKAAGFFAKLTASLLPDGQKVASDILLGAAMLPIESKVATCRYSLTGDEIVRYKELGSDATEAMRRVVDRLELGDSETAVAEKIRSELAAGGMASVVTLVAADDRISRYRHPVPTAKTWSKTLLLVTCAKRNGLIASLSRMVCVGSVPDELQRKTEAAANVNASLLSATQEGASGGELYQIAADAYTKVGFADEIDRHHQGGATGYRTRDWVAHPLNNETVQRDQAFAWNPSITGTKVEETSIAGENGVEIITRSPDFPQIETVVNGKTYYSPGILSL